MLIIQDIIAMIALMILASLPAKGISPDRGIFIITLVGKIVIVFGVSYLLTKYILPNIMKHVAKSQEFLLIFGIGRCLLYAASMEAFGFSLEIGALIAGLTMASLPYRFEIESKMRPLRDFFIVLFFVFLGSQLQLNELVSYIIPIIVFSLFVLIGKPLIVIGIMNRL